MTFLHIANEDTTKYTVTAADGVLTLTSTETGISVDLPIQDNLKDFLRAIDVGIFSLKMEANLKIDNRNKKAN